MDDRPRTRTRRMLPGSRSGWQRALVAVIVLGTLNACGADGAPGATTGSSGIPSASPIASTTPSAAPTTSSTPAPSAGPTPTAMPDPKTWKLAWSDEFTGPAGTPPDPKTWGFDLGDGSARGNPGWGNNELETYTASPENAALDGKGDLVLTARKADGTQRCYYGPCSYTSARLTTMANYQLTYGRVEARIKVPSGSGLWPAFWMLGSDLASAGWPACGEIDIMESVGRSPYLVYGTIHGPGYSGSGSFGGVRTLDAAASDAFHVFAVEWQPGRIAWSMDGVVYKVATPADVAPNRWAFDHPFFLLINVAVGGSFGGAVGSDAHFPQAMTVDYVRVYQPAP